MKNFLILVLLSAIVVFSCSKSEKVKLEKDSAAYNLAKELSTKLPTLDPDKNSIIVTTSEFKISAGELVQTLRKNSGARSSQLFNMEPAQLKGIIEQTAEGLAEQKLLLHAAAKNKIEVTPAQIDSVVEVQYSRSGGQEKFLEMLSHNDITIEQVKSDISNYLVIDKFLDKVAVEEIIVSDEDVQHAYNEDKTASVQHILLMTQGKNDAEKQEIYKKMEDILAQAKSGKDFAELAK